MRGSNRTWQRFVSAHDSTDCRNSPFRDRFVSRHDSAGWWSLAPVVFVLAAVYVPALALRSPALALALRRGFSLVCHQQTERCFVLFGGSVAVCARCLGIYLGAAAGLLLLVPRKRAWLLFATALAMNALDRIAEFSGLHGNMQATRFVLGAALGMAAALLITSAAIKPFEQAQPTGNAHV